MSRHDDKRIRSLLKTLEIAKSQVETVTLYLTVNGNDKEKQWDGILAGEHIDHAIDRLKPHVQQPRQEDEKILSARPRVAVIND